MVLQAPYGIVACIVPWKYPILLIGLDRLDFLCDSTDGLEGRAGAGGGERRGDQTKRDAPAHHVAVRRDLRPCRPVW